MFSVATFYNLESFFFLLFFTVTLYVCPTHGPRYAISSEGDIKTFRSILGQDFLHSFGNGDTKIDLYVDKNRSKYSINKRLSK